MGLGVLDEDHDLFERPYLKKDSTGYGLEKTGMVELDMPFRQSRWTLALPIGPHFRY